MSMRPRINYGWERLQLGLPKYLACDDRPIERFIMAAQSSMIRAQKRLGWTFTMAREGDGIVIERVEGKPRRGFKPLVAYPWHELEVGESRVVRIDDRPRKTFYGAVNSSRYRVQKATGRKFKGTRLNVGIRMTRTA